MSTKGWIWSQKQEIQMSSPFPCTTGAKPHSTRAGCCPKGESHELVFRTTTSARLGPLPQHTGLEATASS